MKILLLPIASEGPAIPKHIDEVDFFGGGPPLGRFRGANLLNFSRRTLQYALIALLIGWLPLSVLTAAQGLMSGDGSLHSFLTDYAVLARSMIAAPLLVLAEALTALRLSAIARYFRDAGVVRDRDAARFLWITQSTCRLRDSGIVEAIVITGAVMLSTALVWSIPPQGLPAWHYAEAGLSSPAGLWNQFISMPILLMFILGLFWRLILWVRFLWLVSRLDLRLVPSHPDGAAGLKFLGMSLHALALPAFALGVVPAGTIVNKVLNQHIPVLSFQHEILVFVIMTLTVMVVPLSLFSGKLLAALRQGTMSYGLLARDMGRQMERRWLNRRLDEKALDANDFSATTDLYAVVANVYTMNIVPVSIKNLAVAAVFTGAPFLPVALTVLSPEDLLRKFSGFLL